MKPEFDANGVQIYLGDCREVLRQLPSESVHCCVTSPPYWGLRDYGCDGQIGLEDSPVKYIATMREVFAEVRRVLRSDGTLWLNMGDSYSGSWARSDNPGGKGGLSKMQASNLGSYTVGESPGRAVPRVCPDGLKPKDLVGIPWMLAFALREPWTNWRIKTEAMRAWVGGIVDGEGCITILRTKSSHSGSLSFPPVVQVRMCDMEPLQRLVDVAGSSFGKPQMPPSHLAASQRESYQWKLVSESAAEVIAEIYPFLTCKRKQAIVAWNHQQFRSARGNQERKNGDLEKEQFCKELINKLNQRQPADIPSWMKEPSVKQEPGWYLRQDLIWAKPNPMPESVTDRCTKSHEYIFLLSKSERYYYNQEAIKEPALDPQEDARRIGLATLDGKSTPDEKRNGIRQKKINKPRGWASGDDHSAVGWATQERQGSTEARYQDDYEISGKRNRRSVWQVTTEAFPEAHFATFPQELIKPCILAGCPEGGTVLDPFMGSGTTGLVARALHSKAIGIELNPAYIEIAAKRLQQEVFAFTELWEASKRNG